MNSISPPFAAQRFARGTNGVVISCRQRQAVEPWQLPWANIGRMTAPVSPEVALVEARVSARLAALISEARASGLGAEPSREPVLPTINLVPEPAMK
jgi:hypothetical protein